MTPTIRRSPRARLACRRPAAPLPVRAACSPVFSERTVPPPSRTGDPDRREPGGACCVSDVIALSPPRATVSGRAAFWLLTGQFTGDMTRPSARSLQSHEEVSHGNNRLTTYSATFHAADLRAG